MNSEVYENNNETLFKNEYESVKPTENFTQLFGRLEENSKKNRYKNVLPYDTTRVVLQGVQSDYINASHIHGVNGSKTYIATQCPKKRTIYDFWLMVLQEKVRLIVCLASKSEGPKKFLEYWPSEDEEMSFNNITLSVRYQIEYIDFVVVLVTVLKDNTKTYVKIVNYTSWPDHGIPVRPISFVNFVRYCQLEGNNEPIVVHCSAGIGRTGSFIMCDHLTRTNSNSSDIVNYLKTIRACRPFLVSSVVQYKFVHLILDEYKNFVDTIITKDILTNCEVSNYQYDTFSDRFRNLYSIFPQSNHRLEIYAINGFQKYFTVNLKEASFNQIWEVIEDENIECIVVLQNTQSEQFWPKCHEMTSVGNSFVSTNHVKVRTDYYVHTILNLQTHHVIKLYEYRNWNSNDLIPKNNNTFAKFFSEVICDKLIPEKLPVMICCSDGLTASGIYIALNLLIEKFKLENIIDMYWAVHSLKTQNQLFLEEVVQHQAIYEILQNVIRISTLTEE